MIPSRSRPGRMTGVRAAAYVSLVAAARCSESAARFFEYAAAGLVRLGELQAAIGQEWRVSGARESEHYILSGLMEWEKKFYFRFLHPTDRVLLVGCGTGRDLIGLLESGYRADGIDVVPECIATARHLLEQRGLKASVYTGAIESFAMPGRYDAVVFSWSCFGYIPHAARRIEVLRRVSKALEPNGRILLSYLPAPAGPPRPLGVTRLVARLSRSNWQPEDGDVLALSGRGRRIARYVHCFRANEVAAEANAAGLRLLFHDVIDPGLVVLGV